MLYSQQTVVIIDLYATFGVIQMLFQMRMSEISEEDSKFPYSSS